mgnify:CR=1 FL=1
MEEEAQKKINTIYAEMESELKKLRSKVKKERNTNELTAILRARQEIELVKVPLFIEMIEERFKFSIPNYEKIKNIINKH